MDGEAHQIGIAIIGKKVYEVWNLEVQGQQTTLYVPEGQDLSERIDAILDKWQEPTIFV